MSPLVEGKGCELHWHIHHDAAAMCQHVSTCESRGLGAHVCCVACGTYCTAAVVWLYSSGPSLTARCYARFRTNCAASLSSGLLTAALASILARRPVPLSHTHELISCYMYHQCYSSRVISFDVAWAYIC